MSTFPSYPDPVLPFDDKRRHGDRRRRPTRCTLFTALFSPGRRQRFRRDSEAANCYLDRLSPSVMTWAVLVVILSALDAAFTLLHIQRGGDEIVPTMRWAIEQGPSTFIHLKMALTGAGAILLAMHEHFRLARKLIPLVLLTYTTLILVLGFAVLVITFWPELSLFLLAP